MAGEVLMGEEEHTHDGASMRRTVIARKCGPASPRIDMTPTRNQVAPMFGASKIKRLEAELHQASARFAGLEQKLAEAREAKRQTAKEHGAALQAARLDAGNQRALAALLLQQLEISETSPVDTGTLPLPLPPVSLRLRVGNDLAAKSFLDFGRTRAAEISDLLAQAGAKPQAGAQILDFGCGCGRVLRHFPQYFPGCNFTGLDVDAEALEWCRHHFRGPFEFHQSPHAPPSPLAGPQFDVVLALSVFTHLPVELELQWIEELARLTKPDGWLLLTFLDEEIMTREGFLPSTALEAGQGLFYYQGSVTEGLPGYYKSSYHEEAAVARLWSPHVDVVSIHPKAVNGRQSAALCRPRRG